MEEVDVNACSKCAEEKPMASFYKGHRQCKKCMNASSKTYYARNLPAIASYGKTYRETRGAELRVDAKERYKKNRTHLLAKQKSYRKNHSKEILAYHRKYYKKRNKERRKTDINFKLASNLRSRLWQSLAGNIKSAKTLELLGCTVEELREHLQKQFQDDMTWENYGLRGWHVDHIKPCTKFDLSKEAEQRACFHYSNLQPLWAEDNLKKGNKFCVF